MMEIGKDQFRLGLAVSGRNNNKTNKTKKPTKISVPQARENFISPAGKRSVQARSIRQFQDD